MSATIVKALIRILPSSYAARLVRRLASHAQRPDVRPEQRTALDRATRIVYGTAGSNSAWSWGSGPLVIFVHGWNGRAAQLAPLASQIAERGFRCVAVDITAHGDSAGEHPQWHHFIEDIASLATSIGDDVFGLVGHSAGGLAMMAARELEGLDAQAYVCVCTPSHPFPPVRAVRERLNPPERVVDRYRELLASQFKTSWCELEQGRAFAGAGANLMLVYDETDRFVDHQEGDRILSWCKGAALVKTVAYGHTRILAAQELEQVVGEFLLRRMTIADSARTRTSAEYARPQAASLSR